MDRGLSTVFDVAIACLLVTASASLVVTTKHSLLPGDASVLAGEGASPADADRVGRALLPSTIDRPVDGHVVQTSVADLLLNAVQGDGLHASDRRRLRERLRTVSDHVSLEATLVDETGSTRRTLTVGPTPPPGVAVDVAVVPLGGSPGPIDGGPDPARVVLTVRTWST